MGYLCAESLQRGGHIGSRADHNYQASGHERTFPVTDACKPEVVFRATTYLDQGPVETRTLNLWRHTLRRDLFPGDRVS